MPILARAGAAAARGFGMLGKIAAAVDEYFKYVTLLLPGNGTNGAQNNTFLDSSTNNFTITRNGNTTQGTFSPYGSNWSNYFDGSGDQLTIANNAAFDVGSGNFTIEAWVYLTGTTGSVINYTNGQSQNSNFAWEIYQSSATGIQGVICQSNTEYKASSTAFSTNSWNHVALVRNGNTLTIYVNGVAGGTTASVTGITANNPSGATVKLSGYNNASNVITGYVSNARVVKGTAVYTSNFTPSTAPLTAITNTSLLTCQSNRFIDNSTNAFTITRNGDVSVQRFSPFNPTAPYAAGTDGGSGYFDGSGDYLTVANNTAFVFGSGDFTVEIWAYVTSTADQTFYARTNTSGIGTGISIALSGKWYGVVSTDGVNPISITSSASAVPYSWNHVALTRSGTTLTMWVNGVSAGTNTVSGSLNDPATTIYLGAAFTGSIVNAISGYMSNVRVVKGTAVYTAAFTPPTAPLTAITNTSLLTNFTNAGIIDNAEMNNLETVGNAQISTTQSKFGGASMSFNGTNSYLYTKSVGNTTAGFGTGSFTVEAWVYPTATGVQCVFDTRASDSSGAGFFFGLYTGNALLFFTDGTVYSGGVVPTNTWTHVALVRAGSAVTGYINGNSVLTATKSNNFTDTNIQIGASTLVTSSSANYFNGYIDDLRITKGVARYTANFTAPTAPFPLQ